MERNVEQARSLIKFYNNLTGCSLSMSKQSNQEAVFTCLERTGNDPIVVKNHVRQWVKEHINDGNLSVRLEECFEAIVVPKAITPAPAENPINASLELITKTVADIVVKTSTDDIKTKILESLQNEAREFIAKEYGPIEKKITINLNETKREMKGVLHEKFEKVLKYVAKGKGVFLVGPAGCGKNFLCKQVADALGLKFYFTNAVTQEYKITGFTDAMGKYQPTQFYKAFTEGGLFMLDEMDASIPEVLNILNAALANKYFDFPAPIGFKKAHKDFRVIAAGNTTGHGADYQYVGRNQQDGAGLDRFIEVDVDYSPEIENNNALGDIKLADFCRAFRKAAKKVGVNIIVSYRAISNIADMKDDLPMEDLLKDCLIKDLEKDDLNMITNELPDSEYKKVLRHICEVM